MIELHRLTDVVSVLWSDGGSPLDPTECFRQCGHQVLQVADLVGHGEAASDKLLQRACQSSPDANDLKPEVAIEEPGQTLDVHACVCLLPVRDEDDASIAGHVQHR